LDEFRRYGMPLKLGLKEIERNLLLYSLVTVLLIVIFTILTFAVTAALLGTKKYVAVNKIMDTDDSICYCTQMLFEPGSKILVKNKEQLKDALKENVHIAAQYEIVGARIKDREANVWSYDWELLDAYRPNIVKGRWFRKQDMTDENMLYGVAVDDGTYAVGDVVSVTSWAQQAFVDVKIIGLIKNSTDVLGFDAYKAQTYDYTDFFYTYHTEGEEKPLLLLSNDQLDLCPYVESLQASENATIVRQQKGLLFMQPETDQVREEINAFMYAEEGMALCSESATEIEAGSKRMILGILNRTLPIVICSFLLVLLVTISVGTISVKQQMHNYAIYNLCGLSWGRCTRISFTASVICSVLAFVISHVGMLAARISGILSETAFDVGVYSIAICLIVQIIYIGISLIIPACILRGKSVKIILTTNRE